MYCVGNYQTFWERVLSICHEVCRTLIFSLFDWLHILRVESAAYVHLLAENQGALISDASRLQKCDTLYSYIR